MDVYHQILLSLYEACGGNEQKVVNLIDLIRREGFGGSLDNICTFMSDQGWIAEASGQGAYRITHWGLEEARRSATAGRRNRGGCVTDSRRTEGHWGGARAGRPF